MDNDRVLPRRVRPRISLMGAILLMTIAGMAIVIVQLWREVGPLRREVESLRAEVRVLGIDDPSKIHVVQVKAPGSFHWTRRIWLPKGHDYWFCASTDVPATGISRCQYRNRLGIGGREITLRVGVAPSENGKRYVYIKSGNADSPFFEVEKTKWVNGETMISMDIAGATSQVSSNVVEPLVLLRLAEDSRTSTKQPPDGVLIWISNKKMP
jgi:hypothetical protein